MAVSQYMTKNRPKRQYLEFNGKSSSDFHLYLTAPGVYNSPSPDVEVVSVPGLNGDLVRDNARSGMHRFSNVDIQYDAFFFNGLPIKTQAVKSWLLSPVGYQKLKDTYDPDFYRMAICIQAVDFDLTRQKAAQMELVFNCKPQRWLEKGQEPIELNTSGSVLLNPFEFYAEPIIKVSGTGEGTLTIGDYQVVIYSFEDDVILNCETQNAYHPDGTFCNDNIYSDDFPVLGPGENVIGWDGGITSVEITPRWWTL